VLGLAQRATAQAWPPLAERLCDPAFENCRTQLLELIENETEGIDVAFWFMEDLRYRTEIIERWNAGVPVRVLVDPRANTQYGYLTNATVLADLANAGIPIRRRSTSYGILHWKMMLFREQKTVEFSGANYSDDAFVAVTPYANYVDEAIYFTNDEAVVKSFMTKFDDLWVHTTKYVDYANVPSPRERVYEIFTKDPELNFPETENYATRAIGRYNAETPQINGKIDVIMYRITDRRHTDAMIAAHERGVPVRLIGDMKEYREPSRLWVSWNLERLYMAGIPIRVPAHAGMNHQKSVILYGQGMTIFGSSNWTGASANQQQEHNYFTKKGWIFDWFVDQFERKWNNTNPVGANETAWFVPQPPDRPVNKSIANGAVGVSTTGQKLTWYPGPWAHLYDVYFGVDPNPPLLAGNVNLGDPSESPTATKSFTLPTLQAGTTYYWRIVSKTMALRTANGPLWSFTTAGTPPPPPPAPAGATTINIWAADVPAASLVGLWQFTTDPTAAGGQALLNPDKGKAKISPPLASPANYFEATFPAMAGVPYHLWIRMRASSNSLSNYAVSAQFSDSLSAFGSPMYQIGTASGAEVILQDGASGTISGWGWADNAYGTFGPDIYFAATGTHTIRIQQRNDGAIIDQIVLSPETYIRTPPGAGRNDSTILASTISGAAPPPPAPPPAPWSAEDVGTVGVNGFVRYDPATGTYSVRAGGGDIWGTQDGMYFVHQPLSGDGSIVARVRGVENTNAWARSGVMVRESLAPNARNAFMFMTAGRTMAFQRRIGTGGSTIGTLGATNSATPNWVRLDRFGHTFTAYHSRDGVTWTFVGSDTIAMATDVYIGLAATSLKVTATGLSTLDAVAVTPGTPVRPVAPPIDPPLPAGWLHQDVGSVAFTGSAWFDPAASIFSVKGAGADIWGSADAFHFAYRSLTGDGAIVARVKTQQNTNSSAKAGVMIREALAANAANAFMALTPSNGSSFQRRTVAAGTTIATIVASIKAPYWVKLERQGSTFTASQSVDGVSWTRVGSESIAMGQTVYVGLAVTSHATMATSTSTFDYVSAQ
jgi:phosphatidylserine/phosphatidylglycerophosphate/cardiolipin synthase-like enzyme/regulation of enolase protein 1 (concanavalin A-like superfamily)